MLGRSGYQILSFENIEISQGSSVVIKGSFAKAKAKLPVLITQLNVGENVSGFSYDSYPGSTTTAMLPIIITSGGVNVIATIQITSDDEVELIVS